MVKNAIYLGKFNNETVKRPPPPPKKIMIIIIFLFKHHKTAQMLLSVIGQSFGHVVPKAIWARVQNPWRSSPTRVG